jgi:Protein of unknown function (DUF2892)
MSGIVLRQELMMFHKKNVPGWERALRIVAGLGAIAFGLVGMSQGLLSYGIVATGAFVILTGFVGFCPACWMVGRKFY